MVNLWLEILLLHNDLPLTSIWLIYEVIDRYSSQTSNSSLKTFSVRIFANKFWANLFKIIFKNISHYILRIVNSITSFFWNLNWGSCCEFKTLLMLLEWFLLHNIKCLWSKSKKKINEKRSKFMFELDSNRPVNFKVKSRLKLNSSEKIECVTSSDSTS